MRNGNTETDTGAHRFFALFERCQNSITIFRFDLAARDQQIDQLNDGVPALGRLHFRDDLISGKKLSQRHADSSGAGSLSCRLRMTRSIWWRWSPLNSRSICGCASPLALLERVEKPPFPLPALRVSS